MFRLRNKADCIRWITFTLYLMVLFCGGEVEAIDKRYKAKQKRKRSSRGKKTSEDLNLSGGFWMVGLLLCSVTVPTIAYFVYSVLQDPITPSVMKDAWDVAKLKYFGYISSGSGTSGSTSSSNRSNSSPRSYRDKQIFDRAMMSRRSSAGITTSRSSSGNDSSDVRSVNSNNMATVSISDDDEDVVDVEGSGGNVLHRD